MNNEAANLKLGERYRNGFGTEQVVRVSAQYQAIKFKVICAESGESGRVKSFGLREMMEKKPMASSITISHFYIPSQSR
ncbi:unnamed protein product [Sphagnum balticum]